MVRPRFRIQVTGQGRVSLASCKPWNEMRRRTETPCQTGSACLADVHATKRTRSTLAGRHWRERLEAVIGWVVGGGHCAPVGVAGSRQGRDAHDVTDLPSLSQTAVAQTYAQHP